MTTILIGLLTTLGLGAVAYYIGVTTQARNVTRRAKRAEIKAELREDVINMEEKRKEYAKAKKRRGAKPTTDRT